MNEEEKMKWRRTALIGLGVLALLAIAIIVTAIEILS